jgi:hypothetical protein
VQDNPAGDDTSVKTTVPVSALTGAMVIVEVPAAPAIAMLVGLADIEKSGGMKKTWTAKLLWKVNVK